MNLLNIVSTGDELRFEVLDSSIVFTTSPSLLKSMECSVSHSDSSRIVLDISSVEVVDSSAIGLFITIKGIADRMNRGFVLMGASDYICRILLFLELDTYFFGPKGCKSTRVQQTGSLTQAAG